MREMALILGLLNRRTMDMILSYPAFPWIQRQAVVLYENQAQAYIRLNGGNASGYTSLYYTVSGEITTPTPVVVPRFDQSPFEQDHLHLCERCRVRHGQNRRVEYILWIETKKCVGGDKKMQMDNLSSNGDGTAAGPSAGNQALLSYTFACIGIDDFRPEDCPCERTRAARVCWKYAGKAEVSVDLRPGWCWNGRGIWGGATDVVTLMAGFTDLDPTTMPMPLAANVITAGAGCSKNFDEAKLAVNLVKTALYGYKTIKSLGIDDPTFNEQLWGSLYGNQAANAIEALFSDDYVQTTGSCGTVINPGGVMLDGCRFFDLEINRTLVVALVSNSKLIVEGHGKYQGNARILSSYALSGTVSKSDPDQTGENCCSNGHGVYSLSSFYPGMSTSSSQSWVSTNFIAAGLNLIPGLNLNITGEYGKRGGGERPDCKLVIVDGRSDGHSASTTEQPSHLQALGNSIWIQNQPEAQQWHFSVMDAGGRILHTRHGSGTDIAVYDFENYPIPSGIYFVQLRTGTGVESLRVVKTH